MQPKTVLRILEHTLAAIGVAAIGYCGLIVLEARWFQYQEKQTLLKALRAAPPPVIPHVTQPKPLPELNFREGSPLGLLEIPKLGLSTMVLEGTDSKVLQRAAGHVEGTAFPWGPGNSAIAGHRDTFFRPLRNIHPKDEIVVTTLRGRFRYEVDWTKIVDPHQTEVLRRGSRQALTLITCYPFHYIGHAPKRFIVHAVRLAG
ncbi:MAG: class D sortase [Bryobacterales bacterium]|nr:class D sortase [Bryobacterales bacterium]